MATPQLTTGLKELKETFIKQGLSEELIDKCFVENIKSNQIKNAGKIKTSKPQVARRKSGLFTKLKWLILLLIIPVSLGVLLHTHNYDTEEIKISIRDYITLSPCILDSSSLMMEVTRPFLNCSRCENLRKFPEATRMTREEFRVKHAYNAVPVVVRQAAANWTAMHTFNYQYFKDLYLKHEGSLDNVEEQCQFFSWGSEFHTLEEAFQMDQPRVDREPGYRPWYFGWSNCHSDIKEELRRHYRKPYFLPSDSEDGDLDWMFMGTTGQGAFIHLDSVERPSWQAQITGRKTWSLEPVPECEHVCHNLQVTVNPGDIIIIDSNQWYHMTDVQEGDISLTIGSEYD